MLDRSTVYTKARWGAAALLIFLYSWRVYLLQGWYIVSYGLGIFLLNTAIGFVSPQIDPDAVEGGGPVLPTAGKGGEFRPFTRRVPEFKAWHSTVKAVLASIVMTFFSFFDIPGTFALRSVALTLRFGLFWGVEMRSADQLPTHKSVLADFARVLCAPALHDHEAADCAHDQASLRAVVQRENSLRPERPRQRARRLQGRRHVSLENTSKQPPPFFHAQGWRRDSWASRVVAAALAPPPPASLPQGKLSKGEIKLSKGGLGRGFLWGGP